MSAADHMSQFQRILLVISLAALTLLAGGCMTYQRVPLDRAVEVLEPGDFVRVELEDGSTVQFELEEIDTSPVEGTGEGIRGAILIGEESRIPLATVVEIERKERKSTSLAPGDVAEGVAGAALLLAGMLAIAFLLAIATA